ncbi:MAG: glycosyltransferase family 2 protein [Anaerolinea sp.]|nr:glycosyltransferase family 2 protein [Anaerolinea sp.]
MTEQKPTPDFTIVIPVYYNEGCLKPLMHNLYEEVLLKNPQRCGEIIFVDDGSGDRSLQELLQLQNEYPALIKVIQLTRNFGQGNAVLAGFHQARGKCVITMSADGQDPVSLINQMLDAHYQENFDIVACSRVGRDESYYRKITSQFFYMLMQKLTFPNMPKGGFDFLLMSRRALETSLRNWDQNIFLQGQLLWMGYPIKFIEYHRQRRIAGKSRWTFAKKLTMLIDGILAYSFFPIRMISAIGFIVAILGFLYAAWIFVAWFIWGNPVQGWAPLMIMILVMGGLQMLMLGVIGEYLWRTLSQTRHRDLYIVQQLYDFKTSGGPTDEKS